MRRPAGVHDIQEAIGIDPDSDRSGAASLLRKICILRMRILMVHCRCSARLPVRNMVTSTAATAPYRIDPGKAVYHALTEEEKRRGRAAIKRKKRQAEIASSVLKGPNEPDVLCKPR